MCCVPQSYVFLYMKVFKCVQQTETYQFLGPKREPLLKFHSNLCHRQTLSNDLLLSILKCLWLNFEPYLRGKNTTQDSNNQYDLCSLRAQGGFCILFVSCNVHPFQSLCICFEPTHPKDDVRAFFVE